MGPYNIFLSLKPSKMTSDFIMSYLEKYIGGATTQKYQKQYKNYDILTMDAAQGCQNICQNLLDNILMVLSTNIELKLSKVLYMSKETHFFQKWLSFAQFVYFLREVCSFDM